MNIPNAPNSFKQLKRVLLTDSYPSIYQANSFIICPVCLLPSQSSTHCNNSECSEYESCWQRPFEQMHLSILNQLRAIFKSTEIKIEHDAEKPIDDGYVRDIYDGRKYRHIIENEKEPFVSLTMNIDGVEVSKSSSLSLWIVTFAINEIARHERFRLKNIVIGGILSSPTKPSRNLIQRFIDPIVKQLVSLEEGELMEIKTDGGLKMKRIKVFLIASCCDKPAQSLTQGISESIGAYGCGRCELKGIIVV